MASFQDKIGWKMPRNKKIKIISPFRSVPTRHVIENSKKLAKKFENLKNTILAPFQAKIGCKTYRKSENKNCNSVPTLRIIENSKKIAKKLKKLKYTIRASFQDKICWKMPRNRKNKNYWSVPFPHDA